MKYIILLTLFLLAGCASPDSGWGATADNWHKKV